MARRHRTGRQYSRGVGLPGRSRNTCSEEFPSLAVMREWRRARGILPKRVPDTMILLYQNLLYNGIIEYGGTTPLGGRGGIYEKIVSPRCHLMGASISSAISASVRPSRP